MSYINTATHIAKPLTRRTSQSLLISVSEPTHGRKRSTLTQQCLRAIAGELLKSRSGHLINLDGGGHVITPKSATALMLDRYVQYLKRQRHELRQKKIQDLELEKSSNFALDN